MSARVSVCVPVYNGGAFIDETIRSILGQTYTDFELVAVDNVSTDDTLERLHAHAQADPRVRVIAADEHVGAVQNFQRATAECAGEYVKLVCADDTLAPRCLELQVAALDAHPGAALAACRRVIVDETGAPILREHGLRGLEGLIGGREALARCVRSGTNQIGEPAAVLMRGDVLRDAGTWSDEWPYMTDLELWFRLLHRGDLVALREPLATFRVHTTGWSAAMGGTQAQQARRLFAREGRRPDGDLSRLDLARGAATAQLLQYGRVGLYAWRNLAGRRRVARKATHPLPTRHA